VFLINRIVVIVKLNFDEFAGAILKISPLTPEIKGPLLIEIEPFKDKRGFFTERFNLAKFKEAGLTAEFVQDNHSMSQPQVLRGIHLQFDPPQEKLIWVASGKIFDVIVDCRPSSPTAFKVASIILDSNTISQLLWIPTGFAHGFCVLDDKPAHVIYKMTSFYNPHGETGLLWNDPDLKINWPIKNPILSARDQNLLKVKDFRERFFK